MPNNDNQYKRATQPMLPEAPGAHLHKSFELSAFASGSSSITPKIVKIEA
jgi:hypothetical protein